METVSKLYHELEEQLNFIHLETDDPLKEAELSIQVIVNALSKLKKYIGKHKFRTQSEEIKFFKYGKPQFISKLIFHISIYNIHSRMPKGGEKIVRKYLHHELQNLRRYFDNNLDFYKYYRTGSNYLDHKYFVRGKYDIRLTLDTFYFETDPLFSTSHDYKVAKIIANDLLQVYLEDAISSLERKDNNMATQDFPKVKLYWTESKTALIELIYALHSQGAIDNGKADIKDIAAVFEHFFGVELGDFYRTFLEIRVRKTGRTKFIDSLKQSLVKKMEEADDK